MMSKYKIIGVLTIILLLGSSCSYSPKYEKLEADVVEELHSQVLNGTFMFGGIDNLWVHDSLLIILDYKQDKIIQFFNKETGTNLGGAVSRGQGVNEIVSIYNTHYCDKSGVLYLYDADSRKILACNLSEWESKDCFTIKFPNYDQRPNKIFPLNNNEFVALHGLTRFTKARDGKVIASLNKYPEIPDFQGTENIRYMFFSGETLTAMKPDGSRLVQVSLLGSILQILDINETSIESSAIRYFQKPIFDDVNGMIQITKESIIGFTRVQTTDNYIYATHLGKAGFIESTKELFIFDWNGNVVKKLMADCEIFNFCIDEPNNKIYVVTLNDESEAILVTMDYEI